MKYAMRLPLLLVACTLLCCESGCNRRARSLLAYVPSDSIAILIAKWASVRNDPDLKSFVQGDRMEEQIRRVGIESSKIDQLVVFAAGNSKAALLLHGTFDRRQVAEHLKASGWTESTINGRKIYSNANDYVSLPGDGVLVAGMREGTLAALETGQGTQKSIESEKSFRNLEKEISVTKMPISAYLIASEGTIEMADTALAVTVAAMSFFGYGEIGKVLQKLNVASAAAFAVNRASTSQKLAVNFCVAMRDEQAAVLAAGALGVMKTMSAFVGTADDTANLQSFEVSRRKTILSINMEMPRKALLPPEGL